jgi:dipeptidase D
LAFLNGLQTQNIVNQNIAQLEPSLLWTNFAALNAVPRPSKKEARVIAFVKNFGARLQLPTTVDAVGNVIIKKPATPGMEQRETVVLQSHLDMVHQKNNATQFDFETEGIRMFIDGDWVKAEGTTLGADNGIGVAAIMALLESTDIPHPALEALFTIDEETGMTGAMGLEGGLLSGKIMLNLDTEDDDELTIGCAGGIDTTVTTQFETETLENPEILLAISVKGLSGGHSGMDIHKGLGNANKIMTRLLTTAYNHGAVRLVAMDGGSLRNAIPRECTAKFAMKASFFAAMEATLTHCKDTITQEYKITDPNLAIAWESLPPKPVQVLKDADQRTLLNALYACPNGILRMSPSIPGLVQTSTNLARVVLEEGNFTALLLSRSSVDSEKREMTRIIEAAFGAVQAQISHTGDYPGWTPQPEAAIIKIMQQLYSELFDGQARVAACHAGLECGILGSNYPSMQMISFGPNIRGAHSPDERVQITSVQKFWRFLLATLAQTPVKE